MRRGTHLVSALVALGLFFLPQPDVARSSPSASFTAAYYALAGGVVQESSPTLADLSGDGLPEIIVGTTAYNGTNGQRDRPTHLVALKGQANPTTWFTIDVGAPVKSSPAVGDIDGDGDVEVVVSVGGDAAQEGHGGIRAYDGLTGGYAMHFDTSEYPPEDGLPDGVFSSPLLCDVDADGDMEIAFGAWDQRIYLIDHYGNSLWQDPYRGGAGYFNADTIWSSATCADLNKDGYKEIIIGADIHKGGILPDGTEPEDGGYLYVFDKDGNVLVRRYVHEAIYSSPAVADLTGDGNIEIVVGTSYAYWPIYGRQPYVHVFRTTEVFGERHYSDPDKLPHLSGWPQPTNNYPGFSSPALADLDDDGDLEIVIGAGKPSGASAPGACSDSASDPDCYGALYAWHHTGAAVSGFPMWPKDYMGKNSFVRSSPTIGDVDSDGELEITISMLWDVIIVGSDGIQEYTPQNLHTSYSLFASPAIGDTDGDGKVEIWIGGSEYSDRSRGYLWRFESDTSGFEEAPWPMFHRDQHNTGAVVPPKLDATPTSLFMMHQYGSSSSENRLLTVSNQGDGDILWEVTSSPPEVSATPLNGETDCTGQTVELEISTTGLMTGTHSLGNVRLVGTKDGEEVDNSPLEIPVDLYVGQVHHTFLPLVLSGN